MKASRKTWTVFIGLLMSLVIWFAITRMPGSDVAQSSTNGTEGDSTAIPNETGVSNTDHAPASPIPSNTVEMISDDPDDEVPSISSILSNVREATLPTTRLTVLMQQSVTRMGQAPAVNDEQNALVGKVSNVVVELDDKGFRSQSPQKTTSRSPGLSGTRQQLQPAQVQVTMNPVQGLQEMLAWNDVQIERTDCHGHPCYKIIGHSGGPMSATIVVDRERWCIYDISVKIDDQTVIVASVEYAQHPSGIWLPASNVIEHPTENIRITQDFGKFAQAH